MTKLEGSQVQTNRPQVSMAAVNHIYVFHEVLNRAKNQTIL